jgi:hypothetical protein
MDGDDQTCCKRGILSPAGSTASFQSPRTLMMATGSQLSYQATQPSRHHHKWGIINPKAARLFTVTKGRFQKGNTSALAPIGPANGAGPRPARARPARGRRTSATDTALCTVADLQGPRQRMASRVLQRLVRRMASTPRRSGQMLSVLQNRGARCGPNWLSLRLDSWTTGTWTRTGGIGSNKRSAVAAVV